MPIPLSCPNCHTNLQAPDTTAGRMVKCPSCGTPFPVPQQGADIPEAVLDSAPPPPRRREPEYREDYRDDDYDDEGPPRRRRERYRDPYQPSGPGMGLQMGMGIASLCVGAAGLMIAMIPCIGFYPGLIAGGVGLVLGLVGLIVAFTQQGRGIAFPIAGASTSVVALLVAWYWWYTVLRPVQQAAQGWANFAKNAPQNAFEMAREQQRQAFELQKQRMEKMPKQPQFNDPFGGDNAARERSKNNLKQIALAFHQFNDAHGQLPYAAGDGKNGKGQLSWRVALLPYLEHENLYRQFRLNEPWDSEHNRTLLPRMPQIYAPVKGVPRPNSTYYQVFTGPNAPFQADQPAQLKASFTDGLSNTFLVVEASDAVDWTRPADLPFNRNGGLPRIGGTLFGDGFNAALADGSVRVIQRNRYNDDLLRNLIDPRDGNVINWPD